MAEILSNSIGTIATLTMITWYLLPIVLCALIPIGIIQWIMKRHRKKKESKSEIEEIMSNLDTIEKELDEQSYIDNSNGKIIRIDSIRD